MQFPAVLLDNALDPLAIAGAASIALAIGWHSFQDAWKSCAPPRSDRPAPSKPR